MMSGRFISEPVIILPSDPLGLVLQEKAFEVTRASKLKALVMLHAKRYTRTTCSAWIRARVSSEGGMRAGSFGDDARRRRFYLP
jgi:hypothetical protein